MHARIWGTGTDLTGPNKENGEANGSHQIPNEGSGVDINSCAVIECTRPNICVIATMLHISRDRSWMFCGKVVVVPMDRQFEVLPIMSAWDYVTHGDTLYITFNPGSAAREEESDSSPAAVLNTRMTGGVTAKFTYQEVDGGFECS